VGARARLPGLPVRASRPGTAERAVAVPQYPPSTSISGVLQRPVEPRHYTSKDYAAIARVNGVTLSRWATGCAYDNAVAESFFATIKRELITTRPWRSVTELRRAIFNYVEGWYNTRRLHSSLSYVGPARWEAAHRTRTAEAA
jgi:transposase InsO family protein